MIRKDVAGKERDFRLRALGVRQARGKVGWQNQQLGGDAGAVAGVQAMRDEDGSHEGGNQRSDFAVILPALLTFQSPVTYHES